MSTQPKALRLADDLEIYGPPSAPQLQSVRYQAAAELRRLHAKTVDADQVIEQRNAMLSSLHALNAELADALRKTVADAESNIRSEFEGTKEFRKRLASLDHARAAIAKAEGQR